MKERRTITQELHDLLRATDALRRVHLETSKLFLEMEDWSNRINKENEKFKDLLDIMCKNLDRITIQNDSFRKDDRLHSE